MNVLRKQFIKNNLQYLFFKIDLFNLFLEKKSNFFALFFCDKS